MRAARKAAARAARQLLTFRENTFATTAVRIQEERGQRVISTGPYAYVRHPLYAGALLYLVGTPLLLGSWYGLVCSIVPIVGLGIRAVVEERVLRNELPGYDRYTTQVRYRFVPRLW
jgi:protein-S-isoprenylcysteine O-methyltransferase Ste14